MRGLALTLALASCTHAQAPKARLAGEVLSIAGVVGLVTGALTTHLTNRTPEIMGAASLTSAFGIALYAVGDLTDPVRGPAPESEAHKLRRWAKILTERAAGAAREGRCPRVRRLEKRVNLYNRDVHDFVFMKDPEILRCLEAPAPTDAPPDPAPEAAPPPGDRPAPARPSPEASPSPDGSPTPGGSPSPDGSPTPGGSPSPPPATPP